MRDWFLFTPLVVLFVSGCARPVDDPALRSGDSVRPEIAFAPTQPWPAEAEVNLGMLVQVSRPGSETRYLSDAEVIPERAVMQGLVTFLSGGRPLGEPLEVPFVRDC